ncbi:MAG: NHL repeat-containing protein, partial [Candidatus Eisenbacteria bacterium]
MRRMVGAFLFLLVLATSGVSSPASSATCPVPVGGWGVPGAGPGQFNLPTALVRDPSGRWLITDQHNNRVQIFDPVGNPLGSFGSFGTGPGQLFHPSGIAVGSNNLVYVTDHQNHRVSVFTLAGAFVQTFGSYGLGPGQLRYPVGIDVDAAGRVYVADYQNNRIQMFLLDGSFVGSLAAGLVSGPYGVRVASDATVWVGEYDGHFVRR